MREKAVAASNHGHPQREAPAGYLSSSRLFLATHADQAVRASSS